MFTLIFAHDDRGCIGLNGRLPWRCEKDLKWFQSVVKNQNVLCGSKTYKGISKLLKRLNTNPHVLTSNPIHDVKCFTSLSEVYKLIDKHFYVIGGASVYEAMYKDAALIVATHIHGVYEGDAFVRLPSDVDEFVKLDTCSFKLSKSPMRADVNVYFNTHAPICDVNACLKKII